MSCDKHKDCPECAEHDAALVAVRIAKWRERTGGPWAEVDVADFKLLNEVYNDGFEAAHELRRCGHSAGDFRDRNYIPGKIETYTGKESCIGCEREAKLEAENAGLRSELSEMCRKAVINMEKANRFTYDDLLKEVTEARALLGEKP